MRENMHKFLCIAFLCLFGLAVQFLIFYELDSKLELIFKVKVQQQKSELSNSVDMEKNFFDCMSTNTWIVLQKLKFMPGVRVIPIDLQFVNCMSNGDNKLQTSKFFKLAILYESVNDTSAEAMFQELLTSLCIISMKQSQCLQLKCVNDVQLHLVHLIDKGDYFTGQNCLKNDNSESSSSFGLISFLTLNMPANQSVFVYPINVVRFQKHLTASTLVECNHTLANSVKTQYEAHLIPRPQLNTVHFHLMIQLRNRLQEEDLLPMMCGKTLLGWARECGVIPYFNHIFNLMVNREEYNEIMNNRPLENLNLPAMHYFKKVDSGYEYSYLKERGVKVDLYFVNQKGRHSWNSGLPNKILPKMSKICAADFHGALFHIPCNYDEYLVAEHGNKWSEPFQTDYLVYNKGPHTLKKINPPVVDGTPNIVQYPDYESDS